MGRLGFYDNPERRARWQDLLRDYSVEGKRVEVEYPVHFTGTIIRQMAISESASPHALFMVALDKPILLKDYLGGIRHTYHGAKPDYTLIERQLYQLGCIDERMGFPVVVNAWANWNQMTAISIQRGQPLEYEEHASSSGVYSSLTTLGISQNVYKNPKNGHTIVEFFLLEPLSWFRSPQAIETDFLKAEFVSRFTSALTVEGVYRDWKEKSPETLPAGNTSEDGNEYILNEITELSEVARFIKDKSGFEGEDATRAMLEASFFHIIPIDVDHNSGKFRPMRMEHTGYILPYVVTRRDVEEALGEDAPEA